MKVILFLAISMLVRSARLDCPTDAIADPISGKCYVFHSSPALFMDAEGDCKQRKGHLSSIANAMQNSLLSANARNVNISGSMWIGMASLMSGDEKWQWIDNSLVEYMDWIGIEASVQFYPMSCAQMDNSNGKWSVQNCNEKLPFVCTVPIMDGKVLDDFAATAPMASCDEGWTNINNSCFKVVGNPFNPFNHSVAVEYCNANSAKLASIHNWDENGAIADMFPYPSDGFIGIQRVNETTYQWMDGSPWDFDCFLFHTSNVNYMWGTIGDNDWYMEHWAAADDIHTWFFAVCKKPLSEH